MALLWIDGFEGYGGVGTASGVAARGYAYVGNSPNIAAGRLYGYCYWCNITYNINLTTPILTTDGTLIAGMAVNTAASGMAFYYNRTQGPNISLTSTSLVTKLGGTTLDTNTSFTLSSPWYYVEMKCVCHPTNGSIEVRINGVTITSLTGINTQTGTEAYYNIVKTYGGSTTRIDDFYVCDSTGTTCNDFLGVCKIAAIFPNSDTSTVQWTPSTGITHYNLVDENPANSATDYVSSSTQAEVDMYGYPSLVGDSTILGIQISTQAIIASGSSVLIETPILSNSITEVDDGVQLSSTSYVDRRRISTIDPGTGTAWTVSSLAAAKIGIKVM